MATYPIVLRPSFSYEDHLMFNQYAADVEKGLITASSAILKSHGSSTEIIREALAENTSTLVDTIITSSDQISASILNSTELVTREIAILNNTVTHGLDGVNTTINGLRADFDIAMGKILAQFEMSRSEMQAGLSRIVTILENKRKSEAKEHFRDGLDFYKEGCRFVDKPQWFTDALRHFLASVEGYERNPFAHLYIGHIFHYQNEHRDLARAI